MKSFVEFYKSLDDSFKKRSLLIFITYLFVLFSYPFVRASVGSIFYEHYTSSDYSFATFISVIFLIISIFLSNKIQQKFGVHALFSSVTLVTILGLGISYILLEYNIKQFAYALFAIKEVYIVLFVHLVLAFANSYYSLEQVKKLYGPLGAAGSIGGITGGLISSYLATNYGTNIVFYVSLVMVFVAGLFFWFTKLEINKADDNREQKSPLKSISSIKKYVFLIALIIAISQWIIFLADLQFNIQFEQLVTSKDERTSYLSKMFSYVNMITFIFQIFLIPFLLSKVSTKRIFFSLPVFYLILVVCSQMLGMSALFIVAGVFILMKASDYSLFTVAKEIMYHPLKKQQKYGAKYLTDMFAYRLSKAIIALIASLVSLKSLNVISMMQLFFISLWFVSIYILFKERHKILKKEYT